MYRRMLKQVKNIAVYHQYRIQEGEAIVSLGEQCTVYYEQCIMCSVQCTVYAVEYTYVRGRG